MIDYIKTDTTIEAIPCHDNGYRKDIFFITNKIPKTYRIWNINTNGEFVPFVKLIPNTYTVDFNCPLYAIEMPQENAYLLFTASMWAGDFDKWQKFVDKKSNQKNYPEIVDKVRKAIPIYQSLIG